jgi:hypothetical protein
LISDLSRGVLHRPCLLILQAQGICVTTQCQALAKHKWNLQTSGGTEDTFLVQGSGPWMNIGTPYKP